MTLPSPLLTLGSRRSTPLRFLPGHLELITKTDNRTNIFPGQIASYIVTVMNRGPSAISGVSITDNFPDSLTSVSWTCSATTGSRCAASGTLPGNINTTISLFPNGAATFNANATVKNSDTGQVSNTALINSPIDPLTNNKTATDTTTIIPQADLELEVSAPVTITTTSLLTYTVNITNNGPSYATNLILTDMLPAGVTFITTTLSAQSCTLEPGKVTCNLSNLPQLSTLHFEIVVLTPASPGPIANVVDIKADEADPNPANNRATTVVAALGEHRNEHQLETVARLGPLQGLEIVHDPDALWAALARGQSVAAGSAGAGPAPELIAAIRHFSGLAAA